MGGRGSGPRQEPKNPEPLADDIDLWERQPEETGVAYAAFREYLDQGPGSRSGLEVARKVAKSGHLIKRWSARWSWVKRAAAWDRHLDRAAREAEIEAVREARKRHVQIAKLMQGVGGRALEAIFRKIEQDPQAAAELSPSEARLLAETGIKTERLLLGEPGELSEVKVEGDTETSYQAALAKVAQALGVDPEEL